MKLGMSWSAERPGKTLDELGLRLPRWSTPTPDAAVP
jgi:hypothetical protein